MVAGCAFRSWARIETEGLHNRGMRGLFFGGVEAAITALLIDKLDFFMLF
jgi:hypothetical protein